MQPQRLELGDCFHSQIEPLGQAEKAQLFPGIIFQNIGNEVIIIHHRILVDGGHDLSGKLTGD